MSPPTTTSFRYFIKQEIYITLTQQNVNIIKGDGDLRTTFQKASPTIFSKLKNKICSKK